MASRENRVGDLPDASEVLDLFTVKRKRGKASGQYEGVSIKMGNASYTRPAKVADEVLANPGNYSEETVRQAKLVRALAKAKPR